ncbi:putative membrane protein [Ochrobactrum quorumnocens]|uniref:Putative membrane protein n=2 Tax=Brucella/Ochrobactrum group TaxID=2826938 RepID=A0A256F343_9HYPH|nr:putative membrane protein [[Ochrobactrum] quorumnocens]OYR09289.1 putative membrane protein [Brucella rhizosphaerae]
MGRRCAMFEYLTYLKTLDLIVLGFIAFLVCWNIVEYNLRR